MSKLEISLLGPLQVRLEGQLVRNFATKGQALLAYLAVEAQQAHSRERLVGLFWPDQPEAAARLNLRQTLLRLRQVIPPGYLLATRNTLQFDPSSPYSLDVTTFIQLVTACQGHPHADLITCPACLAGLQQAAVLYRGDFLANFFLPDSSAFEEWALLKREWLRREALQALSLLAASAEQQEGYEPAYRYAWRQVELDPLREEAHQQLIRILARQGRRSEALAQYETCRRVLAEELGVEPALETEALVEQVRAGELGREKPLSLAPLLPYLPALLATPRHNLPVQSTPLIGRERELGELAQLLPNPHARLVTVLGPGGIGKTCLAVAAAAGQVERFTHGVTFVSLAPVNPADFTGEINPLVATLAEALKFILQAGSDAVSQLLAHLQARDYLLVLDNFEHFLGSDHFPATADFLNRLLSQAPGVKILVTSRERLNLREEWLFPLKGLAFPAKTTKTFPETFEVWASYGAIQLFEQRARQVQPHFDLAAEQPWVEQICRLVEGMPLGIELAAAWVRLLPCQAIVQELQKGLDLLATPLRNVPERQRSMRTVFEHSWRLLSAAEREVMRKLSIFRGGFQREAAEAVAGASLGLLSALVDKSLVLVTPAGRYDLHELLRQYAEEKLHQRTEEESEAQAHHGRYYLTFLADQERHLKGPCLKQARAAIEADIDNIRLAWRWAVEGGHLTEIAPAMESLWLFYELQGWLLEGADAFARIAAKIRPFCNLHTITEEAPLREACLILGRAMGYQGHFQSRAGLSQAKALCQESLALLRSVGEQAWRETALVLYTLAYITGFVEGQHRVAVSLLRESLELTRGVNDQWGTGHTLVDLGQHLKELGEYSEAEQILQESINCFNEIGEQQFIIYAISTLGYIAEAQEQYSQAEVIHRECLSRRIEVGDQPGQAFTLRSLGWVSFNQGKQAQAKQYFEQTITLGQEIGLSMATSQSLLGLGWIALKCGDYIEARRRFQESLAVGEWSYVNLWGLSSLGWAALGLGEDDEAEKHFYEVLRASTTNHLWPLASETLIGLAHLLVKRDEPEMALELLVLASNYPTIDQFTKDMAASLQTELAATLPSKVIAVAQARGRSRELEATAKELLVEKAPGRWKV